MFIKSIVLDGFKSYGNRVEITGFDPEFNAITGLNGTGKSNILDSICFVLGITNLSNVRAGSLQELIYKHGQAGITKATVSIIFDNRDKRQCPIGYENHDEITVTRQVVMGGKNKYLINGINVQNKRVADLFCSVQLNVNNPHFLIMQGRITKVLNMKPPEILSMVEEAAGTRMYEAKKQAAQKTIEKKDAKLRELNDIIREDIAPKLQKLQDERSQFQEYQKVVRELENLTRVHVAYQYVTAEENVKEAEAKVAKVKEEIQSKKDNIKDNEKECKELDNEIAELNKKLDEESGSALAALAARLAGEERAEAAALAGWRAAQDALHAHERKARLLDKAMADDERALREKSKTLDEVSATFEQLKAASAAGEAALAAARDKFLAVSSGLEGASDSLQDQLMAAKQEASEASTLASQCRMEREHCAERLRALERQADGLAPQQRGDQRLLLERQARLRQLQEELSALAHSPARLGALQESCRELTRSTRQQRDGVDALAARLQRCNFVYSDPEPGFDRSRVKGPVCRLIEVRDPAFCTALETAAGGRLYNVVVDSERTSKALLTRGRLAARATVIPLDRITGSAIDARTLATAQEIGGGPDNVQLALDLISFPEELRPAMAWVFGQTLVCRELAAAKRVTFDPRVRRRCVTLDGDVFDPSGTLSGGARAQGGSVLMQLAALRELEGRLRAGEAGLRADGAELARLQLQADKFNALQRKIEEVSAEVQLVSTRVAGSAHAQRRAEADALRARQAELGRDLEAAERARGEAGARAADLELKMKDIKGHREREFKKAESALKKAQSESERLGGAWRAREQDWGTLRLECAELGRAVAAARAQLDGCVGAALELRQLHDAAQAAHGAAAEAVKKTSAAIKKQKAAIAARSGDVARLQQRQEALRAAAAGLALAVEERRYRVAELQAGAADCALRISTLEAEHPWIATEKQYFGLAGGLYELGARGAAAGGRAAQLAARRDRLARGLNARAHTLLGKEEEQYQDVMRKKAIVEADRAKLVQVMAELDEKKRRVLLAACAQVNRDFGGIFGTLLPRAHAQLAPPPGRTVLDGLEVKVGFAGQWKESLGELSGGQRSLVALALVLAMLQCKPAPLYILDEVDAALDLSHTQNIGQMLKEHFTDSQFIIVSLKDGMFNNANVLFRTKFVDGMSSVQRTVNRR